MSDLKEFTVCHIDDQDEWGPRIVVEHVDASSAEEVFELTCRARLVDPIVFSGRLFVEESA